MDSGELFVTDLEEGKKKMSNYFVSEINKAEDRIERYEIMLNSLTREESYE